jgi:hypothetical protein
VEGVSDDALAAVLLDSGLKLHASGFKLQRET